jgi:hypothetical protein
MIGRLLGIRCESDYIDFAGLEFKEDITRDWAGI